MRKAGILFPVFSLPGAYGIGTLGKEAFAFVDFLKEAGQSIWQILPLGPTGYGDSPYQSFSSFAGNPYFIDLEALIEEGLLTKAQCDAVDFGDNPFDIDYEKLYFGRFKLYRKAYESAKKKGMIASSKYKKFVRNNAYWLEDYALYMAVKDSFGGVNFMEWDEDIRKREKTAMASYKKKLSEEIECYKFQQYLFATQWEKLKKYANKKGIEIIGDIPIYVAFDSADTWANPGLFELDKEGYPTKVAGCPPDCFTADGQLWGNPLYKWPEHKKTGYAWWLGRMKKCFELYDIVRIDHFRGFDEYWAVPYGDKTAVGGKWLKGPGYSLFAAINKEFGTGRIIAEDLGFITDSVRNLIKKCGYPGMKILQFAFDANGDSEHLPHYCDKNYVIYTGTHDNFTLKAWIDQMGKEDIKFAKKYLNVKKRKQLPESYIRAAHQTASETCVIPIQDYMMLGNEARINAPSTLGTNWRWRINKNELNEELAKFIKSFAKVYGRLPKKEAK
ncbi:MAG: 4-alpha-glucanotransferase [Lachnospiraceae bacterium]|nr:4-alpha-glucanotransferase [Lachnospiraceae bacterium]